MEILFAVLILGIGFIMVAGIFPVAISQTDANGSETAAASVGREAVSYLSNLNPNTMVADGTVHRFGPQTAGSTTDPDYLLWQMVSGSLILPEDPRYAWVPMYVRGKDANGVPDQSARVIIVVVKVRNHPAYNAASDLTIVQPATGGTNSLPQATLMARPVTVQLQAGSNGAPDTIQFLTSSGGGTVDVGSGSEGSDDAVAAGSFVIIQNDPNGSAAGSAAGWVLRVGEPTVAGTNVWALQPGGDMKSSTYKPTTTLSAFVVGQGADPDNPATFSGGAQDVMVYSSNIQVR